MSKLDVPAILESGAKTFRERNAIYGDSWEGHVNVMRTLFPEGVTLVSFDDFAIYTWMSHIAGKLVRFKNSKFKNLDSVHDISVYAAIIEAYLKMREGEDAKADRSRGTGSNRARRAKRDNKS